MRVAGERSARLGGRRRSRLLAVAVLLHGNADHRDGLLRRRQVASEDDLIHG